MTHPQPGDPVVAAPGLPPVAIIGLPQLADHCRTLGLDVLTEDAPEAAAAATWMYLEQTGPLPVIVSDHALGAVASWMSGIGERTAVTITLGPDSDRISGAANQIALPASVAQILETVGFAGVHPDAGTLVVGSTDTPATPAPSPQAPAHTPPVTQPAPPVTQPAPPAPEPAPAVDNGADLPWNGVALVTWSGKGGVGKSTTALSLAQRAADAGLRTVLIDGNSGQGDLRTFLRVGTAGLPSIYQAATTGNPDAAIIDPATLNASRPPKLEPINFHVVQAPPPHLGDAGMVSAHDYHRVVRHALTTFDVVVIDTQIVESVDRTGMVDHFLGPLLLGGAWGVAVTDLSSPSISNLLTRMKVFEAHGVKPDRMLAIINRVPSVAVNDVEGIASAMSAHASVAGYVLSDETIPDNTNRGRPVAHLTGLSAVLDNALRTATGRTDLFAGSYATGPAVTTATSASATPAPEAKESRSFFGGLRKKK